MPTTTLHSEDGPAVDLQRGERIMLPAPILQPADPETACIIQYDYVCLLACDANFRLRRHRRPEAHGCAEGDGAVDMDLKVS